MDFDNPKVYGDTFISDGLVYYNDIIAPLDKLIMLHFINATRASESKACKLRILT